MRRSDPSPCGDPTPHHAAIPPLTMRRSYPSPCGDPTPHHAAILPLTMRRSDPSPCGDLTPHHVAILPLTMPHGEGWGRGLVGPMSHHGDTEGHRGYLCVLRASVVKSLTTETQRGTEFIVVFSAPLRCLLHHRDTEGKTDRTRSVIPTAPGLQRPITHGHKPHRDPAPVCSAPTTCGAARRCGPPAVPSPSPS